VHRRLHLVFIAFANGTRLRINQARQLDHRIARSVDLPLAAVPQPRAHLAVAENGAVNEAARACPVSPWTGSDGRLRRRPPTIRACAPERKDSREFSRARVHRADAFILCSMRGRALSRYSRRRSVLGLPRSAAARTSVRMEEQFCC